MKSPVPSPKPSVVAPALGIAHRLLPLVMVFAFAIAIWILWRALATHSLGEIRAYLADLPLHAQELVRSLAGPAETQRSVTHA